MAVPQAGRRICHPGRLRGTLLPGLRRQASLITTVIGCIPTLMTGSPPSTAAAQESGGAWLARPGSPGANAYSCSMCRTATAGPQGSPPRPPAQLRPVHVEHVDRHRPRLPLPPQPSPPQHPPAVLRSPAVFRSPAGGLLFPPAFLPGTRVRQQPCPAGGEAFPRAEPGMSRCPAFGAGKRFPRLPACPAPVVVARPAGKDRGTRLRPRLFPPGLLVDMINSRHVIGDLLAFSEELPVFPHFPAAVEAVRILGEQVPAPAGNGTAAAHPVISVSERTSRIMEQVNAISEVIGSPG